MPELRQLGAVMAKHYFLFLPESFFFKILLVVAVKV